MIKKNIIYLNLLLLIETLNDNLQKQRNQRQLTQYLSQQTTSNNKLQKMNKLHNNKKQQQAMPLTYVCY